MAFEFEKYCEQKISQWGYTDIRRFQMAYQIDPSGEVCAETAKMIVGRTCDVPDTLRTEKARWQPSCATGLTLSYNFENLPRLSSQVTKGVFEVAAARWTNAFDADWDIREAIHRAGLTAVPKLPLGTVIHEIGHSLGLLHSPSDPNSVMYPSMRGQFDINGTDIANLRKLGYSENNPIGLRLAVWKGPGGTHIYCIMWPFPGGILADAMIPPGRCDFSSRERYDSTQNWNTGGLVTAKKPPDAPPDPGPPDGQTIVIPQTITAGTYRKIKGNGDWWPIQQ